MYRLTVPKPIEMQLLGQEKKTYTFVEWWQESMDMSRVLTEGGRAAARRGDKLYDALEDQKEADVIELEDAELELLKEVVEGKDDQVLYKARRLTRPFSEAVDKAVKQKPTTPPTKG